MADDTLLTIKEVCAFFGGPGQPVHKASIYNWIKEGRVPPPVRIGAKISRWRKSECQEALDAMIAATKPPSEPEEN